jgi:hypothetical protein
MAVKTRADILTAITTLFADNTTGNISAEDLRSLCNDLADSSVNSSTDTASTGLSAYDTSRVYYSGNIVQYDYKWYKANSTTTAGAFDSGDWDFQGYIQYSVIKVIEPAQVLALNTTPQTLVSAIASKVIQPVHASAKLVYNTVEYTTNQTLQILTSGSSIPIYDFTAFLAGTATKSRVASDVGNGELINNTAIVANVASGNPAAGNSTITIYLSYIVI